jgi:rubrerythrin
MKIDREKMEALLDREIGDADITEVKEAIDIAIKGEEDTILIYSWLINALDEMNRSVLSDIIVSERSHRDLVTGLRNKLFPS